MTPLKANEIRLMEKSCQLAAEILIYASKMVAPGVKTEDIDKAVHEYTLSRGALSAPLGYHGYPKAICTSVNDCICHGVPDNRPLQNGDIINIDITCIKEGFYGDTSATYFVGEVSQKAKDLSDCAYQAMHKGIEAIAPHGTVGDIGFAIQKFVTKKGYYAVKEIGGHGIGRKFHDEPFVPSYGKRGRGAPLRPWHCITVEPMVNETEAHITEYSIPNSSVMYYHTSDKTLSAQYEHTVLVTDVGYEILTLCE